ncbi:DUF6901 family protein [Bacteroidota bacterium]
MSIVETSKKIITYTYKFVFSSGEEKKYIVNLDPKTLKLIKDENPSPPNWTKLKNFKCSHCPLNEDEHQYCPVALNIDDIISFFSDTNSFEEVEVVVETSERKYLKNTSVQVGVGGLIGVIMPTSGCPIMGRLKPLVRYHLPFATIDETEFRVFSMFLLGQYLIMRKGEKPDWDLHGLKQLYEDIQTLNINVAKKIADLEAKDASINAVVVLNNFANSVSFCLDEDDLSDFEFLFQ